jgi:hypothetical protein
MYPNPVRSQLKIDMGGSAEPVSITVTDMYGRRVANSNVAGASTINTANFAPGVYMVTVTGKNGVVMKQEKIVKE